MQEDNFIRYITLMWNTVISEIKCTYIHIPIEPQHNTCVLKISPNS